MKARGLVLLGVSALLGLAAVVWVKKPSANVGMAPVVVAKVALNFGDQLTDAKLSIAEIPPSSLPEGAFNRIDQIAGPNENRVVLRAMVPGEPVLPAKISGTNGRAILSTIIEPKMRGAAIRVNDVNGVAGFVQPGDRVDVMLTLNDREQADTTLLLQDVKVLGVDQQADDKKDKPSVAKTVTLEVTPDDAQKLALASAKGTLTLALRNYADPDPVAPRHLSLGDLLPTLPKGTNSQPAPAPEPKRTLQIFRGTDPTTYDVSGGNTDVPDSTGAKPKSGPVRRQ